MSIYRVGGAVRDLLRGYDPKDYDFVVVGETPESFLKMFPSARQIGKSFPVYQLSDNGVVMEFAFARRERKISQGHGGFEVESDPSVTLEEDLFRRDLTVNAIALPHVYQNNLPLEPQVIDPFGGVVDLRQGVLRHVSEHFSEDPLRVYRLARFAAKLGFVIDPETYRVARAIDREELYSLSAERVAEETRKAMKTDQPRRYFEELARLFALEPWFPELVKLIGVPAGPREHHGEPDSFVHTMMVLDLACAAENQGDGDEIDPEAIRWAALTHDLGKAYTPKEEWPRHVDHDQRGVHVVERFYDRLKLPTALKEAAVLACREHLRVHRFTEMSKGKQVDLIKVADRTRLRAEGLAVVAMADSLGREALVKHVEGAQALLAVADACREETGHPIPMSLQGEHIGLHIRNKKGNAIRRKLRELGYL